MITRLAVVWLYFLSRKLLPMGFSQRKIAKFIYITSPTSTCPTSFTSEQPLHTEKLFHISDLHREAFTHRSFYTEKPLHRQVFTHRSFYTQKLLHTEAFTHRSFYAEKSLRRRALTHRGVYTETNVRSEAFTHR